ncbi:MAG: polysaccharide biosynthesis/export family protein [Anaeromyxobacter sp.]|nr:polysaccharide biosynthesis/export family protein [Anaeromyxobacter sp.]
MTQPPVSTELSSRAGQPRRASGGRPVPGLRWALVPAALGLLVALSGCAASGQAVRVEDLKPSADPEEEYRIAPGDVLSVRVWNQEAMSVARTRVRDDGRISVPFLQDVEAANRTPAELATVLKARLQAFVVGPVVTITLEDLRPLRIPVTGEVARPGIYEVDRKTGVLAALAAAGGLGEFARRDAVHVLRYQVPLGEVAPARIRFGYQALLRGERPAAAFRLREGDVVVVE